MLDLVGNPEDGFSRYKAHLQKLFSFLRDHLDRHGFKCICKSPQEFSSASDCARYTKRSHTSLVIGIHAYKAGKLLKGGYRKVP